MADLPKTITVCGVEATSFAATEPISSSLPTYCYTSDLLKTAVNLTALVYSARCTVTINIALSDTVHIGGGATKPTLAEAVTVLEADMARKLAGFSGLLDWAKARTNA